MLYSIGNQVYKLQSLKQWKINDIFYISFLDQDTTRNGQVDKKITELEFEAGNSKEYKVEAI